MKRLLHAALVLFAMGAVLMPPGVAAAADKIKVVATFTVIADMVTNVAGDLVDLVTIVGTDSDCEVTSRPLRIFRKLPALGSCS
jgi:ABC-type Zn uptake system ZnuABC Zn-binding protein ZnuA